jgi:ketosteroid isomerase-like protein
MDTETLADQVAITTVLHRYAFAIDDKDWQGLRDVFSVDCTADYGPFGRFEGIDAVVAWLAPVHVGLTTQHAMSNIVAQVTGRTATARSYVTVSLQPDDGPLLRVGGGYSDLLRQVDGQWRIAERVYSTIWQQQAT